MFNGNVQYGVFKQNKTPPAFKENNNWNDAIDEIGRPVFNVNTLFRQKSIPPPFKPNNNWGDAIDLIERPVFDGVQDSSEIEASTFEPYYKRLEVEVGDKTLNKVLKIDKKDINDVEWLNEYKRRLNAGESKEQLKRFPPFGRRQNTVRVERSFNNAGSIDTKLKILNAEMDKSSSNELELAKQLTLLLNGVEQLEGLQLRMVGELVTRFEAQYTLKEFGFNRFYTKKGLKELQTNERGKLLLYVLGRSTILGGSIDKPILKIDAESDLSLLDEKKQYIAATSLMRGMRNDDSVVDLQNLMIYNDTDALVNTYGNIEANDGDGRRINIGQKYLVDTDDETGDETDDVKIPTRVSPPSSPGSQVSAGDVSYVSGSELEEDPDSGDDDSDDDLLLGDLTQDLANI